MEPNVYTVAPGHHLQLIITGWDPYRAFLDEDFKLNPELDVHESEYTYTFTVDNDSVKVERPTAP